MIFSSVAFVFYFLPVFLAGYYLLPKIWAKNIFLFLSSLVFYFLGAGKLVILLVIIGFVSWLFSFLIAKTKFKKGSLIIAVCTFVGILIYFKYLGFIIDNLIYAGVKGIQHIEMISSIGLSFFTFQAISYNIDVYRKNNRFEKNPAYVILYITMFPQLILGPLVRYLSIEQQLKQRKFELSRFTEGVKRFIIGLGKKVLIANSIGYLVNQIMDSDITTLSPSVAWLCMIAFPIQLLFDFTGYTDMAIGIGKMLGFDLPENFNYPYISRSITEFWRRWHITLSKWIKDYIFSPLAMNMRYLGNAGVFIALMVTFIVCGIWHGPTWNYIIWGALQGLLLGLEELFFLKYIKRIKWFGMFYIWFVLIMCAVLFRTNDIHQAIDYYSVMFSSAKAGALGLNAFVMREHVFALALGVLFCIPISMPERFKTGRMSAIFQTVITILLIIVFAVSLMRIVGNTSNPFIYFKY
jgi:alginate O-acetyltransferase complex protein AlgI